MNRWKGKVALVTGGSSGIGRATAIRLAEAGMRVAVTGRRVERLEQVCGEIRGRGAEALAIVSDFRRTEELGGAFQTLRKTWGGADVLINNAGLGWEDDLHDGKTEEWKEMLDVNVLALVIAMREALADMEARDGGHIVNVSSIAGHRVFHHLKSTMYSATKHAVQALSEGMRGELVRRGSPVKLSVISPGMVETEWHGRAFRDSERARKAYQEMRPLMPEDIADLICCILATPPHVGINELIVRSVHQLH
jgi:NADP-dependent 3-hydroxy acid dehydrogenase YdfG